MPEVVATVVLSPFARGPLACALDAGSASNDVAHASGWSITVDVRGVAPLGIPRNALRRARKVAQRGVLPERGPLAPCGGQSVARFFETGEFARRHWFGARRDCRCIGCREEYERRAMGVIYSHGFVRSAVHLAVTVPESLRGHVTIDALPKFGAAAQKAAVRAIADALPDVDLDALGGTVRFHPAGKDEKTYHPHWHMFVDGAGLEALSDPRVRAALQEALRDRWLRALANLCKLPAPPAIVAPHVRWYDGDTLDADRRCELERAIRRDLARLFPGWPPVARLRFFGTHKHVEEAGERPEPPPVFDAGAMPLETIREHNGEARTRVLLSKGALEFYAEREEDSKSRASAGMVDGEDAATLLPVTSRVEGGGWALFGVDVRGVAPYTPYVTFGRVAMRVAAADNRLAAALANLAQKMKRETAFVAEDVMRGIRSAAVPALRSARNDVEALIQKVQRRARPSVSHAAAWLTRVLTAIAEGRTPERLSDPPLQISGLIALSELRYARESLTLAAESAPAAITL